MAKIKFDIYGKTVTFAIEPKFHSIFECPICHHDIRGGQCSHEEVMDQHGNRKPGWENAT